MIIGICGGTGSGKTTVANKILETVDSTAVDLLQQDHYYKELAHLPVEERARQNFDHPDSIDMGLFVEHVRLLKTGQPIDRPVYDFTIHTRSRHTVRVEPKPVVIVEGILIFDNKPLRDLMDIKIFVDTDADLRFIRRLRRDIEERARTVESVIHQYLNTVRPMHLEFVEPSKRYADVIIPEGGFNMVGIDLLTEKIRAQLATAQKSPGMSP